MGMNMYVELTIVELRANILRVATKLNDNELNRELAEKELLRIAEEMRDLEQRECPAD
jgi:hypothetical protein